MRREAAARRYAQAAFAIALERDELARWARDLEALAELVAQPGVVEALASSRVRPEEKERLLQAGLPDVGPLALNLVRLLVSKSRVALADQVREEFERLVDEHRGIAHGGVVTAVPLSEDERREVEMRLSEVTGKQVVVEAEVDPSIVGGLVARVGDRLIDGSTRTRLLDLRRDLGGDRAR